MIKMLNWTDREENWIQDFQKETQEIHETAPETIYTVNAGPGKKPVERDEFIREISEIAQDPREKFEIWGAGEYQDGEIVFFEFWTGPPRELLEEPA